MKRIKLAMAGAFAAGVATASAMQVGDVLDFAADGGLQQVTVALQSAEDVFLGRLNDYSLLNASIVADEDGWLMSVDDWENNRRFYIRLDAEGKAVSAMDKCHCLKCGVNGSRTVLKKRAFADSLADAAPDQAQPQPKHDYGDGSFECITEGWNPDSETNTIDMLIVFEQNALDWMKKYRGRNDWFRNEKSSITPNPSFVDKDGSPTADNPMVVPKNYQEAAKLMIANMNAALYNSNIRDVRVNLAGTMTLGARCGRQIPSRKDEDGIDAYINSVLDEITLGNQPFAVNVRRRREILGADLVAVLFHPNKMDDSEGGLSNGLQNDCAENEKGEAKDLQYKFLWRETARSGRLAAYMTCDIYPALRDCTFVHETGHLFGAGHCDTMQYKGAGPQLFQYSAGLMFDEGTGDERQGYHTIMGYEFDHVKDANGKVDPIYYTREIMLFSSPDLKNPWTGKAIGDAEKHDNARTIRETAKVLSQYRVAKARRDYRKGYGYPAGQPLELNFSDYTGYTATGIPSGMKWDKKTGILSGTPKRPGSYIISFIDRDSKPKERHAQYFETVVIAK